VSTMVTELLVHLPADHWLRDTDLLDGVRLRPLVAAWARCYTKLNTRTEYLRDLGRAYAYFEAHGIALLDAERPQLASWGRDMRDGLDPGSHGPASESTVARRFASISSFFSYVVEYREESTDQAVRTQLPAHNPAANLRRPDLSVHRAGLYGAWLDQAQAHTLMRAARADTPRSYALVAVMLSTAARTGEIFAADVADLSHLGQDRVLHVPRQVGLEYLPIDDTAAGALDAYLGTRATGPLLRTEPAAGHLGGSRLDEPYTLRLLRRLATEAGLPAEISRQMNPHALRRRALIQASLEGASEEQLQALAGYADVRTIRRYITQAEAEEGWRTP
jgi:integrase/recombinase XerD